MTTTTSTPRASNATTNSRLARYAAIIAVALVASRILGLVREQIMAATFSPGAELDAYRLAFLLPDTLFALLSGGALSSAFIPVFSQLRRGGKDAEAWRMASGVVGAMAAALFILASLTWVLAPYLIADVIGRRVSDPETLRMATNLLRIVLLQPLFLSLALISTSILHSHEVFALPALGPIVYNICIILGALFLAPVMGIYGVAVGVVVGAFLFLLITVPSVIRLGLRLPRSWPLADRNVRRTFALMGPRLVGKMAAHVNVVVAIGLAAGLGRGRASAYGFAWTLFLLPIALFASSVSSATFPALSREAGDTNRTTYLYILRRSLRGIFFFVLPAGVGLMMLRVPIVALIYERGEWSRGDTLLTAQPLLYFSLAMWAFALVDLLPKAFYALQETKTPVLISISVIALDIALSFLLIGSMGLGGLALAWAVSVLVQVMLLLYALGRKVGTVIDAGTRTFVTKAILATVAMAAVLWLAHPLLANYSALTFGELLARVGFTVAGAAFVYIGVSLALKQEEVTLLLRMASRRRR